MRRFSHPLTTFCRSHAPCPPRRGACACEARSFSRFRVRFIPLRGGLCPRTGIGSLVCPSRSSAMNPRKSKVSGLPCPRCRRSFRAAPARDWMSAGSCQGVFPVQIFRTVLHGAQVQRSTRPVCAENPPPKSSAYRTIDRQRAIDLVARATSSAEPQVEDVPSAGRCSPKSVKPPPLRRSPQIILPLSSFHDAGVQPCA